MLAGGVLAGLLAMLLAAGGGRSPMAIALVGVLGTVLAMLGIVTLAGPVWLLLHRRGVRGPVAAAATAGLLSLAVFTVAQGGGAGGYHLVSALGTSFMIALAAAAIGAAMHRVAYRRLL